MKIETQDKVAEITFHKLSLRDILQSEPEKTVNYQRIYRSVRSIFAGSNIILDAGCGTGTFARIMSKEGYIIVGLDICKDLVRFSKSINNTEGFMPVVGDLERMPFREGCFDSCICIFVLHHFPSIKGVCSELYRVVKNKGRVLVIDTNGSNPYLKLSRRIAGLFKVLLEKIGRASKNERSHNHSTYIKRLSENGFRNIHLRSGFMASMRIKRRSCASLLIFIISIIESIIFKVTWKTLPQPLNGHFLIISAQK